MVKAGCCKDKKKQVKLTLDQEKSSATNALLFQVFTPTSLLQFQEVNNLWENTKPALNYLHGPPLLYYKNPQAFFATFLI